MGTTVSYTKSVNDVIRLAVHACIRSGNNWTGATAEIADYTGCSPDIIRMRCRDRVTGAPRHRNLEDRCWSFLQLVADRQRAALERLENDIKTRRVRDVESDHRAGANALAHLARANDALADFDEARQLNQKG